MAASCGESKEDFPPLEGRLPLWLMLNMSFNNILCGTKFQTTCSVPIINLKKVRGIGARILDEKLGITIS